MTDNSIAKRRNELFKRIKPSTVNKMIQQVIENMTQESLSENHSPTRDDDDAKSVGNLSNMTHITQQTNELGLNVDTQQVIADVRTPEDYDSVHINDSINVPVEAVRNDKFLHICPKIFHMKNKDNKFIIIVDYMERKGVNTAQLFAEKGYDNVYLISGGIEEFLYQFKDKCSGDSIEEEYKKVQKTKNVEKKPKKPMGVRDINTEIKMI